VWIEERKYRIEWSQNDDIDTLIENLFFWIDVLESNRGSEDGSSWMYDTQQWKDIKDSKMIKFIQFSWEYFKSK
jgi:hypothetical protein